MAKVEVLVSDAQKKKLAAKAKKEKKSMSEIIRQLIAGYVKG